MRLARVMILRSLVTSRRQAESLIKLGAVKINNRIIIDPNSLVNDSDRIEIETAERYVSRAALKLASVVSKMKLEFRDKRVLDVGSSTGGFTDYALQHGAKSVVAIDAGTKQLHTKLRKHPKVELHEKTDIRDFKTNQQFDMILVDVSFISLRKVLPHIATLASDGTDILVMVKPQFETYGSVQKNMGIIKNDRIRREILKEFEAWAKSRFVVRAKADSEILGSKGNRERFYLLSK
jgi:23S rRNA (cytidine1920-2'-O)/16S rRNA (cytidine1409-2'-O)-methyltransferase